MNHHPFSFHLAVAFRGVLFVVATIACAVAAPPLAEAQTADPPAELLVSALPEGAGAALLGARPEACRDAVGPLPASRPASPVPGSSRCSDGSLTGAARDSDASADSSAISTECYLWDNLYKRKWGFLWKIWVHRQGGPCQHEDGCLQNAEHKYDHSVKGSGPPHSWEEGGKALDSSHVSCG